MQIDEEQLKKFILKGGLVSKSDFEDAIKKAEEEGGDLPEVRHFVQFIKESKRGVCR